MFSTLSALDYAEIGVLLHIGVVVVLTVRIISVQRNTAMAIAWLTIMFAVPVVGVVGYLMVGEPTIGRRYQSRSRQAKQLLTQILSDRDALNNSLQVRQLLTNDKYAGVSSLGKIQTGFAPNICDKIELLTDNDILFDKLIEDINHAEQMVLMEFYIVYPKGRVLEVFEALKSAVRRGVECHILADSVGSFALFHSDEYKLLKSAGIHIHQSMPVGLFKTLVKRADVRNHRKIVIIDDNIGYTGSFNLVDPRYFKQDKQVGEWIDVFMRISSQTESELVTQMASVVVTDIGAESNSNLNVLHERVKNYTRKLYIKKPAINDVNDTANVLAKPNNTADSCVYIPKQSAEYQVTTQLIPSAPQMTAHVIYNTLISVIHRADKSVSITTPYFVPDEPLLNALMTASRRGVEVTIIVPKKVDSFLVQHASQSYYYELLSAGVNIALFDAGLLHAKTVVIDEEYCLFGTVNMDMRSFYLNMEVTLAIYTPQMVAHVIECQQTYLQHCDIIEIEDWTARPKLAKLFDNGVRLFSPLL